MRALILCVVCVSAPTLVTAQSTGTGMEPLRPVAAEWIRVARIEDARARTQAEVDTLLAALRSPSPAIRAHAARAIGRLERASLGLQLGGVLSQDPNSGVRAAAASAIAQSARDTSDASRHLSMLRSAFQSQPQDRGFLAEHIGRTPHGAEVSAAIVNELVPLLGGTLDQQVGALRGLVFVLRQQPSRRAAFDANAIDAVRRVAQAAQNSDARRRSLALSVLTSLGAADAPTVRVALADTASIVRRDALVAAGTMADTAAARTLLGQGLNDRAGLVRYEALRIFARRFGGTGGCAAARTAAGDTSTHVKLLAIDLLGGACRTAASAAHLDSIAGTLPGAEHGAWHAAAHALVSLARVDSARARPRLHVFLSHPNFFVRTYGAQAAGELGDEASLGRAAADPHANVRTAAIRELSRLAGHRADSIYIAQLQRTDVELILAAAEALEGSTDARAVPALISSLERISEPQRETSRDARVELLKRIGEMGRPADTRLIAWILRDIDPLVSQQAADIIARWNPQEPRRSISTPAAAVRAFPTFDELIALDQSVVAIDLVDGGTILMKLYPFDAPTNAVRFARLAQRGYFDNLTVHRVVPNFVVQGGSPGANEYHGDGPFTRDEVGVPNWRGTVGLSTRGRDTGDAQFYINQIDNIRLDYDYTIFGVVTRGMDVADALQEGARIRQIRIMR